ncbi:undecaprenyldiphospho-muramoylpentapeptide beta-N-acetylglucosaminyltransferase [Peptoniphilus sp. KCTC 25270]|uniref:undecaprenyldiphospho-muramoylpentapeptide beta-N-acetylglucosaminyltransferase n=1 Tax=Peptoniphilus sp. KCTC 25270 TaxID=2897414 RepID=UPI001E29BB7C|nr:undecaprenyldiphospho-muramoylpentapeptide beta-N-acetylglucosaminyltransferase [Peptoniphilus sp. KCTC 25270]MCD1147187.1 undecaprenyldiphospho-muramoylpentapeptide beta-N-acetylglucosaminyltransferase [Peptoniphilus sp. KCTC 25270]
MKVIVSGGGTGGHIYPAIAIAKELQSRDPEIEILYVGKKNSLEEELAKRNGLEFASLRVKGLPRKKINKDSFLSIYELIKGLGDAGKILKNFPANVVVGTGGYVCAPILLRAQRSHIPTMIQEQNAYPGKANRLIAKNVDSIALSFEEAKKYFPEDRNMIQTGNPIRKDFQSMDREESLGKLKMPHEKPIVLSLGGSGGQESTNEAILEMMEDSPTLSFQLVHITGKAHYEDFMSKVPEEYDKESYKILDYSHEIPDWLCVSSLVVASSSAMTLAEISAMAKPSILIPKAYTAGNHQWHNAKSYEAAGAAFVIEEENINGLKLLGAIQSILLDKEKSISMAKASKSLSHLDAAEKIADEILRIAK